MKKALFTATLFAITTASYTYAAPEKLKCGSDASQVEFEAIGKPSLLKIIGKGKGVKCDLSSEKGAVTGRFSFPLDSLDTGIALRDRHMKEKYLKTKENPEATLTITQLQLKNGFPATSKKLTDETFTGKLKLNGVERDVTGKFTANAGADKGDVEAQVEIKLTDYGIALPSFAGVTVADLVKIKVALAGVSKAQ